MKQRIRERERSDAKDAVKDPDPKPLEKTPMEKFKSLAKRLIHVPRHEMDQKRQSRK